MKKVYLISFIWMLTASLFSAKAQVSGMPAGYITVAPTISTAANPVWYNMMATNADVLRVNRYLYYDGTNLKTDAFNSGIADNIQHDKYLWRLEQGTSNGYVRIINKSSGKELFLPAASITNTFVTVANEGVNWKMAASTTIAGSISPVAGQYAFNYEGWTDNRFLNAGDGINMNWGVVSFNTSGSTGRSSGWFFYPVTSTKTVTFSQPENGALTVTATNGTSTPTVLTSGGSVLTGTVANVSLTPASGYHLSMLSVNGNDVTAAVAEGSYKFSVNANATITANFSVTTGTSGIEMKNGLTPNPFRNSFSIDNKTVGSKVFIFDITGKQVMVSANATVNTSTLQNGTYIIKYTSASGTPKTVKAVKE